MPASDSSDDEGVLASALAGSDTPKLVRPTNSDPKLSIGEGPDTRTIDGSKCMCLGCFYPIDTAGNKDFNRNRSSFTICQCGQFFNRTQSQEAIDYGDPVKTPMTCGCCNTQMGTGEVYQTFGKQNYMCGDPNLCWDAGNPVAESDCFRDSCDNNDDLRAFTYPKGVQGVLTTETMCETCFHRRRKALYKGGRAYLLSQEWAPYKKRPAAVTPTKSSSQKRRFNGASIGGASGVSSAGAPSAPPANSEANPVDK